MSPKPWKKKTNKGLMRAPKKALIDPRHHQRHAAPKSEVVVIIKRCVHHRQGCRRRGQCFKTLRASRKSLNLQSGWGEVVARTVHNGFWVSGLVTVDVPECCEAPKIAMQAKIIDNSPYFFTSEKEESNKNV